MNQSSRTVNLLLESGRKYSASQKIRTEGWILWNLLFDIFEKSYHRTPIFSIKVMKRWKEVDKKKNQYCCIKEPLYLFSLSFVSLKLWWLIKSVIHIVIMNWIKMINYFYEKEAPVRLQVSTTYWPFTWLMLIWRFRFPNFLLLFFHLLQKLDALIDTKRITYRTC